MVAYETMQIYDFVTNKPSKLLKKIVNATYFFAVWGFDAMEL